MHWSSHIGTLDEVSLGNTYAAAAAKKAALEDSPATFLILQLLTLTSQFLLNA